MAMAVALWLAGAAHADPVALLRIEIAGDPPGAVVIEAQRADILSVEDAVGHDGRHGIKVRLAPRFDDLMAVMTRDRDGETVVLRVCGQEMLRAMLRGTIPTALFTLSLPDRSLLRRAQAALTGGDCTPALSG